MPSKTGFCFRIHFLSRFRRALRKPEQNALQNLVLFSPTFFTGRIGCHQIGLSTNWGRSFAFCLIRNEPISRLRRALRKPEQYIPLFVIIFVFAFTLSSGSGSLPFPESTPETGRIGRLQIGLSTNWDLSFAFCLIRNESISRFRRALRKPEQNTLQNWFLFSHTFSLPFPESTPETGTEYPPKHGFVFAYIFSRDELAASKLASVRTGVCRLLLLIRNESISRFRRALRRYFLSRFPTFVFSFSPAFSLYPPFRFRICTRFLSRFRRALRKREGKLSRI